MNIRCIKEKIEKQLGNNVKVICNCARNKKELYYGMVSEIYSYVFIVRLDTDENKCFCYSDVLTNNIELYFDNKM